MSHHLYGRKWAEAMQEVMELVQIEYLPLESDRNDDFNVDFKHFALLYIKYIQIYKKLEDCVDQMIHPQKRHFLRDMITMILIRILEVKQNLIYFNPRSKNRYVALDEALTNFKLNPESIDLSVPRFCLDDRDAQANIEIAQMKLEHWLSSFNMSTEPLDLVDPKNPFFIDLTAESALRIIQKNERGRIGIQRAITVATWRKDAQKEMMGGGPSGAEKDDQRSGQVQLEKQALCASLIAAHWKRKIVQRKFQKMRRDEFVFLGMLLPDTVSASTDGTNNGTNSASLGETLGVDHIEIASEVRAKRKRRQAEAEEELERAIKNEADWVTLKKGPDIKADLFEERRQWLVEQRKKKGQFPAAIDDFYKRFDALEKETNDDDDDDAPAAKKKAEPKKDDKNDKNDKKKGGGGDEDDTEEFQAGPTQIVQSFVDKIGEYSEVWEDRDENLNFEQRYDAAYCRERLFPVIEIRIREGVDAQMAKELANLRAMYDKPKKSKKKKAKAKKGKKDKKKKWCVAVGMITNVPDCFPDLVEQEMIKKIKPVYLNEIIGEFAYLGAYQRIQEVYCPPPSMQMVKSLVVEHCILPLCSLQIRQQAPYAARSILFYGPKGSGKTMFARAIATECGATFFDISPATIEKKYTMAKTGSALLIYKVFLVAQHMLTEHEVPSVIYIDNADQVFQTTSKKKKADPDAPSRIKKDLIAAIKQVKIGAESVNTDRILFIGCTSKPFADGVDIKGLKDAFDEFVYLSFPDYASSLKLWTYMINSHGVKVDPTKLNLSNLAHASTGYTAGSIKQACARVLTKRRVEQVDTRPLTVSEFIGPLSRTDYIWPEEWIQFKEFDHLITGEKDRREAALQA